jgi:hypothetical protein
MVLGRQRGPGFIADPPSAGNRGNRIRRSESDKKKNKRRNNGKQRQKGKDALKGIADKKTHFISITQNVPLLNTFAFSPLRHSNFGYTARPKLVSRHDSNCDLCVLCGFFFGPLLQSRQPLGQPGPPEQEAFPGFFGMPVTAA